MLVIHELKRFYYFLATEIIMMIPLMQLQTILQERSWVHHWLMNKHLAFSRIYFSFLCEFMKGFNLLNSTKLLFWSNPPPLIMHPRLEFLEGTRIHYRCNLQHCMEIIFHRAFSRLIWIEIWCERNFKSTAPGKSQTHAAKLQWQRDAEGARTQLMTYRYKHGISQL